MILSIVDLPEPFVPTRPNTSPRRTSNEMPSSARNSLNMSSRRASLMKYSFRFVETLAGDVEDHADVAHVDDHVALRRANGGFGHGHTSRQGRRGVEPPAAGL